MSFINAVICGGPGVDWEFRMHMRWEFIQLGLIQLIDVNHQTIQIQLIFEQKIGSIENELLQTQIDVWIAGLETDEGRCFSRLELNPFNLDDCESVSKHLTSVMKLTSSEQSYASILRHLTLLPPNPFDRYIIILLFQSN